MLTATIIIPSYNEAKRLPAFLTELCELTSGRQDIQIIVSDDGSQLAQFELIRDVVSSLQRHHAHVSIDRADVNQGKGGAIARIVLSCQTDIVGFIDADGSVSASECLRLLRVQMGALAERRIDGRIGTTYSAVLGSRVKMLGNPVTRHPHRHLMGRVFATIVGETFDIPVYDTQCGCKFFVREDLLKIVEHAYDRRWLWDTQVVILLVKAGFKVIEMPVSWHEVPGSKVSLFRDSWRMFVGMLKFKRHLGQIRLPNAEMVVGDGLKHPFSNAS